MNINANHCKLGQTLTNLTGTHPIVNKDKWTKIKELMQIR